MKLPFACVAAAVAACAAEFEAPDAPFQTMPRPADGETVSANPPCFVFPARENSASYTIQFSTTAEFADGDRTQLESACQLTVPADVFRPGTYYWRWRPGRGEDGAEAWSPVRRFVVPADVPAVPFPAMDALVARLKGRRPRLEVPGLDLAALRQQALSRFGPGWVEQVRKRAERLRDRPLLPEPAFLPEARDVKRIEAYQKTFQTTRPFFREMADLAADYLLTGNELSGDEAKRRLLHICGWDPRGSTGIRHNDEPATEVVRYGPTVLDRVYPLLTASERQLCLDCLLTRMTDMMAIWEQRPFEKFPYESHNMGYYLPDMLEASLALVGDAPVEEMLRYTMLQLWSPFYPPYGGADGGWCEGPSYWSWSTAVFARAYRLVQQVTDVPVHLRSNVRQMPFYKLYGNPPYFRLSPFGDGQEGPAAGGTTMALLAALYDNPYAQWYADWQKAVPGALDQLFFSTGRLQAREPIDLPQGRVFHDIGLAAMHSVLADPAENVALLLRSCPFGSISHAFADQNTFAIEAFGQPLIIASGYYQLYGHPHHAEWTRQTKASNSVLVNGEGQPARDWNAKGRIAEFATTVAGDFAVADASQAYGGRLTRFDRQVVFLRPLHTGGPPVIVIRDDLAAPQPATFQFLLHALERFEITPQTQRVTSRRGEVCCQVDYLAPAGLTFEQNDRFTHAPFRAAPNQWHLTASTTEPASEVGSLLVLQPYRPGHGETPMLVRAEAGPSGVIAAVLEAPDRCLTVAFRGRTDAAMVAGLTTDGRVASVCASGAGVRSAVLFAGTRLAAGESRLLQAAEVGSMSCSRYGQDGFLADSGAAGGLLPFASGLGPERRWPDGAPHRGPWWWTTAAAEPPTPGVLRFEGQTPVPFAWERSLYVQRLVARASLPAAAEGSHTLELTLRNSGIGPLGLGVSLGTTAVDSVRLAAGEARTVTVAAIDLTGGGELRLAADESRGGCLAGLDAGAARAYNVNLLPNASFETVVGDKPVGWQAGSITKDARAEITSAPGGRGGGQCLKVTCTAATGGDFGVMLNWPGIRPARRDRAFRLSACVTTDADSVAGVQVTSADWRWWKNTERKRDCPDWTETALEFVLPAGQDLTHVRLHLHSTRTGAELFVDDVSLLELPPTGEGARGPAKQ